MGSSKKHPHIDRPTEEQLRAVLEGRSPLVIELCWAVHRLVVEACPEIEYAVDSVDGAIGYGARQYGYDGWGMAALIPYSKWVSLEFTRATSLDDQVGLLEGTGSAMRHVKVCSLEQLTTIRHELQRLLLAASRLNES